MRLVVDQGSSRGLEFTLRQPVVTLGRSLQNDVVLQDQGVSRHHARIAYESQGWVLSDLGSTNGTYVNGQRIEGSYLLRDGDRIAIGRAILHPEGQEHRPAPTDAGADRVRAGPTASRLAFMIVGAVLVVVVLVAAVVLLVTMLGTEPQPPAAATSSQLDDLLATLPVPDQLQDLVPDLTTRMPQELLEFDLGTMSTPEP